MLFSKLLKKIKYFKLYNFKNDVKIRGISSNSKLIKNNYFFLANFKRNIKKEYIFEAIKNGAVIIITNKIIKNIDTPQLIVKDINKILEIIIKNLFPYSPKNIIGITGTNGKTSVMWMTSNILNLSGSDVTSLGTIGLFENLKQISYNTLTTPEKDFLYQAAFKSYKKKFYEFIFEVSSHAISKKRINKFPINIAAITNITHDHLDFHKTFLNYRNTKLKLFKKYLLKNGFAIINDNIKDIKKLKIELRSKNIKIISYGKKKSDINCYAIKNNKIKIQIYNKYYYINSNNTIDFYLENLSCSIGCCLALGLSKNIIINALPKIKPIKGRMEFVGKIINGSSVYVDYAHTPEALKSALKQNKIKKQRPDLVFGCGGDRDKSKREVMSKIANRYANKVYITDDNPRSEDPKKIRKKLYDFCKKAKEFSDRKNAIKEAIYNLDKNSKLIIAGKGHERKQIYSNKIISFDDFKVAKFFIDKKNKIRK